MLSFDHWGKTSISGADPPVIPVTGEISPDDCLKFIRSHFLWRTVASIATILLRKIKSKFKRESPDDSRALEILFLFITLSVVIFQSI